MENSSLIQYKICQAAILLFQEKGFENTSMSAIASAASIAESELYTYFGNTRDITLFLFQSINTDWQIQVNEVTDKKLVNRFEKALLLKLELILPYTDVLSNMIGLLLRHEKIGIHTARTAHIRWQGLQTIQTVIDGATDAKSLKLKIEQLPSLMYLIHWVVLFLHVQTNDKAKTIKAIQMMVKLLKQANSISFLIQFFPVFKDVGKWADSFLRKDGKEGNDLNDAILKIIYNKRKVINAPKPCLDNTCETCLNMHRHEVSYFTEQNLPVQFILPAFPAKSPNPNKVLGSLPDLGEEIALRALEDVCLEIKSIYPPGAQVTVCSDGRIFSELVGVTDANVTAYVTQINSIIASQNLQHIRIINLEDILKGNSFDVMRQYVIDNYAEPLDELSVKLKSNVNFKNLFNGIHRFITDDRKSLTPEVSANKIKEESKLIALKVIQHSHAWTRFLAYVYPDALRLSVHPYSPHNDKIGINLTKATDNWITPWHGVIVLKKEEYILMKKELAIQLGATLVLKNGQPYYYTLNPKDEL